MQKKPADRPASSRIVVPPGGRLPTADASFTLQAAQVATGIRGRVTDFSGAPLAAQIRVPALDVEVASTAEGLFEIEAPPGVYQVMIWAGDHQTQTTSVEVTRRGMVVMNVELR